MGAYGGPDIITDGADYLNRRRIRIGLIQDTGTTVNSLAWELLR